MTQQYWQTEQSRLRSLVDEYVSKGYTVQVQPNGEQLPPFLKDVRPDLIASKGNEHVVIEVRSRDTLKQEALEPFVRALQGQPGWTFELVLANPPEAAAFGGSYKQLDVQQLLEILNTAEAFIGVDARYASLMIWVAVEGALVNQLNSTESGLPSRSSQRLIKEALSLGLLNPDERQVLEKLAQFRNRFVHAIYAEPLPLIDISQSLATARSLVSREGTGIQRGLT